MTSGWGEWGELRGGAWPEGGGGGGRELEELVGDDPLVDGVGVLEGGGLA